MAPQIVETKKPNPLKAKKTTKPRLEGSAAWEARANTIAVQLDRAARFSGRKTRGYTPTQEQVDQTLAALSQLYGEACGNLRAQRESGPEAAARKVGIF